MPRIRQRAGRMTLIPARAQGRDLGPLKPRRLIVGSGSTRTLPSMPSSLTASSTSSVCRLGMKYGSRLWVSPCRTSPTFQVSSPAWRRLSFGCAAHPHPRNNHDVLLSLLGPWFYIRTRRMPKDPRLHGGARSRAIKPPRSSISGR